MKKWILILTGLVLNTNANTLRLGFFEFNSLLNPKNGFVKNGETGLNADFINSQGYGLGGRAFFGGVGDPVYEDFLFGLGVNGIKKWAHSPSRYAELKMGLGWQQYGNTLEYQQSENAPYWHQTYYARLEPSYHFWWEIIGFKTYALGQYSRRGFELGLGWGIEYTWGK